MKSCLTYDTAQHAFFHGDALNELRALAFLRRKSIPESINEAKRTKLHDGVRCLLNTNEFIGYGKPILGECGGVRSIKAGNELIIYCDMNVRIQLKIGLRAVLELIRH